jgi:hypothetical protein
VLDALSVWFPITLRDVVRDATARGAAPVDARNGPRRLGLPRLGVAAVPSELHPFSQLLPSWLQHYPPLCDAICSASASGAALVVACYGRRLLTTPFVLTTAANA